MNTGGRRIRMRRKKESRDCEKKEKLAFVVKVDIRNERN